MPRIQYGHHPNSVMAWRSFSSQHYRYSFLWSWYKKRIPVYTKSCWKRLLNLKTIHSLLCGIGIFNKIPLRLTKPSEFNKGWQSMLPISSLQMNGPLVVLIWIHWTVECGTSLRRLPAHIVMQFWEVWRRVWWRLCEKCHSASFVKLSTLDPETSDLYRCRRLYSCRSSFWIFKKMKCLCISSLL